MWTPPHGDSQRRGGEVFSARRTSSRRFLLEYEEMAAAWTEAGKSGGSQVVMTGASTRPARWVLHLLIFGALFIGIVLARPGGLVQAAERLRGLMSARGR